MASLYQENKATTEQVFEQKSRMPKRQKQRMEATVQQRPWWSAVLMPFWTDQPTFPVTLISGMEPDAN